MKSDMEQVFAPLFELNKDMPFALREVPGLTGGGSDHASFLAAGVPGFFWRQSGRARYVRTHHTQFDTYDMAIPEYQKHSSIVIAVGAYGIANLDHLLPREGLTPLGALAGAGVGNRRMLGVALGDQLTIEEVLPDGVANKGGLQVGDKILKVDGKEVSEQQDLRRALAEGGPKKTLTIQRDGKTVDVTVEWPAATASQ
jgi:membrane-associated protease RseP (regulator of RpoE activity)